MQSMAYNLASLVQILEQILLRDGHHPPRPWILDPHNQPEVESLLEKARSLKELFGNSSPVARSKRESFDGRIRDATYEAEDIIESYMADQILPIREGESFMFSPPSLQKVIGEFQSLQEEIKMMLDGIQIPDKSPTSQPAESSSRNDPNRNNILVGIRKDLLQLKERLCGNQSKLEVIPIVGMGGIGKTALARNLYDDPLIIYHFDIRVWVTVSQDYDVRSILLGLFECIVKPTDEMPPQMNDKLGLRLYQTLIGRRYIIVLDDIWNTNVWDDIRMFFPDNGNGSRIMLTTRKSSIANYIGSSSSPHHQVNLLSEDDSWNLLRERVFARETCPPELEKIGRKIANGCRGLPLAIQVISGLLSQEKQAQLAYWEQVAEDVSSVVASEDEQCLRVLSLSYMHLPNHLKPCFLYMGAFPEDYEIPRSRLIRLWVAEGFLQPIMNRSPEDVAEIYVKDLVDRNLISVGYQYPNGIVRKYIVHDLLRELSVKKAREEKFLHLRLLSNTECMRRVSLAQVRDINGLSTEIVKLSRSFLFTGSTSRDNLADVFFEMRLLKVLDIFEVEFDKFPYDILQLVNLRYLAFTCRSNLPSSLSALWNLQTIIVRLLSEECDTVDSGVIFSMPQLRHIKFKEEFPDYLSSSSGESFVLQENLQTLSGITVSDNMKRLESTPNLKKLAIGSCYEVHSDINLTCLRKLEKLTCYTTKKPHTHSFLSFLIFPPSLKKLTLIKCVILFGFTERIGTLPNLEVLRLAACTFESPSWLEPAAEGDELFCQLQHLELIKLKNLKNLGANFPRLRHLGIRSCSELEEIPSEMGEIPSLELIEVRDCSPSVEASARKIEEEQLELGNDGLRVVIISVTELLRILEKAGISISKNH